MKKYITLAALLVAGTAFASTESFEATSAAVAVLTLNVDEFEKINGDNFGGANKAIPFFHFDGTWADNTSGYLGVANNGSSSSKKTGLFTAWKKGTGSGKSTELLPSDIFDSSTDWDNIKAISVVYSFDGSTANEKSATEVNAALSIAYINRTTIDTFSASQTNVVFSGIYGFKASGATTNETYVTSCDVMSGAYNLDQVKALSISAIPEPSAFGLLAGLGALALVGTRRRRK